MAKKKEIDQQPEMTSAAEDSSISQTDTEIKEISPGEGNTVHPIDPQHQTDSIFEESAAAELLVSGPATADNSAPQTDSQNDGVLADMDIEGHPSGDAAAQTNPENTNSSASAGSASLQMETKDPSPQTGPESDEFLQYEGGPLIPEASEAPARDTDSEMDVGSGDDPGAGRKKLKAPKTGTKTAKKPISSEKTAAGTQIRTKKNAFSNESDEGELNAAPGQPAGADATGTTSSPQPKPARRRTRRTAQPIVAIDDVRSVETDEDKMRNDLLDLVESMKSKKVLTGTIQGVERSEENPDLSFAVVYHGDFKVIIPAEEAVECPTDLRDRTLADVMHYLLTKRLGAEVDYIVKGADPDTGIAAASRLEAMARKRRAYYFGTDRDGNNLLYEGISAEARIVSVIRAGIFVDMFGVEVYIPLRELSYQRWLDAGAHFQPGQRVLVKVLSINREDRNNIRVAASVKQAGENPYEKALRRYKVDSRYVGTVSMVDTNGVFVSLDGGIDCLCSYPKRGRPPRGARVTVRILGMNRETNRIWGAITHMTTPR